MAANENATRSLDGTSVTITLSGEHAQFVASSIRYLLHADTERATDSTPWDACEQMTVERLDLYVAALQAAIEPYRSAIRQLERQNVIGYWDARLLAYRQACEEAGVDRLDRGVEWPDAAPPTTGPVAICWPTAMLERVVVDLTDEDAQKENPEFIPAGEAIRAQLER